MEKIGFGLLILTLLLYVMAMLGGIIAAFPWGLIGLIPITGFGLLFLKVLNERLNNAEDDYYSKNVDK